MLYKKTEKRPDKRASGKFLFGLVTAVYIGGVFAGCAFTLKNGDNLDFVYRITMTSGFISGSSNPGISACALGRDILCILSVLVLKYSGVLKGFSLCVPFIAGIQNASLYSGMIKSGETGFLKLISYCILKDTAAIFMILLFCQVIISGILEDRRDGKKDIKLSLVYCSGIIFIYAVDYAIKRMFFAV